NIDMYRPGLPAIAAGLDADASAVQLSLTACLIGLAIGQVVVGPISDAAGRRSPLLVSLIGFAISSLLCAVAPNITILVLGRFLQGCTGSAGLVLSRAVARDIFSGRHLTTFYSLLMVINATAPLVAPVAGGAILLLPFADWHTIFVALAGIGIVIVIVVALCLKETLSPPQRITAAVGAIGRTMVDLLRQRSFVGYSIIMGAVHGGSFAYVAGTPFVYQDIYGVSPQTFSLLFGVNGVAIIAGSFAVGRLGSRFGEQTLLRTAVTGAAAATGVLLVMTLLHAPLATLVISLFVYMTCMGMILTGVFALAMADQGHRAGTASAVLGALPMIVGAVIAPLVGLNESSAVPMALALFATAGIGLVGHAVLVTRRPVVATAT
ncbi:MAG: Bcr/CflA family efflux MFS transporter, partial [Stackebrandtia sp.]